VAQLEIYVSRHCFGCLEARRLAAVVAEHFRSLSVRVLDLDVEPDARPENLVAVPTYILDDRIIALGNPREAELFGHIDAWLASARDEADG
jgi:hypothetical protein